MSAHSALSLCGSIYESYLILGAEGQRHSNKSPIPVPREEISRLDPSAAQIWDRLALRIHALEDALLLETRDDHALLEPTSDIKVSSKSLIRLSGENLLPLGYQMGPGTLVLKDESTELLGAVAADVRFLEILQHSDPLTSTFHRTYSCWYFQEVCG